MGLESALPPRWIWCAPTAVEMVWPAVSSGGAAASGESGVAVCDGSPWHDVHVSGMTSSAPFTCFAGSTLLEV